MSLVKRWFKKQDIALLKPQFHYINRKLAIQQQCFVALFENQLWVIFFKEPIFNDLTWLGYTLDQEFQIGQIQSDALNFYNQLIVESHQEDVESFTVKRTHQVLEQQSTDDNPVIQLVNQVLKDAYQKGASDIHFENTLQGLVIKSRIDGVLVETTNLLERTIAEHIISRLKVLAELDIAERRIPQDGRLTVKLEGQDVDLRISIMPGLHGEDAVLRILDKKALTQNDEPLNLKLLGFDKQTMVEIRQLALQPYGMMLVTGPTGSGKTTTLYALLYEQHDGQQKIITIEDPVEYQIKGTLQIPVNEKKGLTFARGLRSILRHDPDKILVGEIRDHETADIAVQAALTGHLVYTSVHANHALDVIGRFRHMEIDLFGFVSSLNGIIAQRLIRLNCTHCKQPIQQDPKLIEYSGIQESELNQYNFYQGTGCEHCQGTGYKGRQAIAEVLIMTDELRELMIQGIPIGQIRKVLQTQGMRFLRQQALAVVAAGDSTLQEINRVTFVER